MSEIFPVSDEDDQNDIVPNFLMTHLGNEEEMRRASSLDTGNDIVFPVKLRLI